MSRKRDLPPMASVAEDAGDGRLFAASAARNAAPICDLLTEYAPKTGAALELASGTGQHVVEFARHLPGLTWEPSEPDDARRRSIRSYAAGVANVAEPVALDATAPGWASDWPDRALIVLVNLIHLISWPETRTLVAEAARALAPGGRLVIYGPFQRGGALTSPGDAEFHDALQARDPELGYKDDFDMLDLFTALGLEIVDVVEMPANNLGLVAQKPMG